MNQRSRLLTAVIAAGAIAAVVGFFVVAQHSRDAAATRLLVDLGLVVVLASAVVVVTRPPSGSLEEILDALRALGRWQRNVRLEPERFGELGELARTYNDVAAALMEHEDPNLGAIKTRKRRGPAPSAAEEDPTLGQVRVISRKKSEPPAEAAADSAPPEDEQADSEPEREPTDEEIRAGRETSPARPAARRADDATSDSTSSDDTASSDDTTSDSGEAHAAASDNDTTIDEAPSDEASGEDDSDSDDAAPIPPLDLEALFKEFVEAKRAHDEDTTDLEYESFKDTIQDESARLQDAHQCRAVRFEVRVQDGEVSLLPRLLR